MIEFTDKYECIEIRIGLTFFGPKWQRAKALEIGFSRIKIITSRAI
jgi:hypothetical protein